jgi:hypothetical protein
LSERLIIFDYSGTLSLEAVAFARSDNLIGHLQKSGLLALGVDNSALFWSIVNETWLTGSTTRLGYRTVMQERIAELFPPKAVEKQAEIARSVAEFVDAYLDHSGIDGNWRLILQKLSRDKTVDVIIATDHYAEATGAIVKHLARWDIPAVPLTADLRSNFIVANSADLEVHKDHEQFWEIVNNALRQNYQRVLLIDDFGQNEQPDDAYGDSVKVSARRQKTAKILRNTFAGDVEIISFALKDEPPGEVIAATSAMIDQFLL